MRRQKKEVKPEPSRSLKHKPPPLLLDTAFNSKQPLYAAGWGWNANSRAGNNTDVEIRFPRQVQKSTDQNYIACAAGKHHTLLVSTEGNVYSFGEGRSNQLGYGNPFTGKPVKGGIVQAFPKEVTPSGSYKFHRDLKIVEVGAGSSFSLAREACYDEGIATITGFYELEHAVSDLLKMFPESASLQKVHCIVRQERYNINKSSEGCVTVWGEGRQGQLGLGQFTTSVEYPTVIPRFFLGGIVVTKLSVGTDHSLAIDSHGHLYSWGSGKSGKLGHGDFEDRFQPDLVRFFRHNQVVACAAGTAHSAAITLATSRVLNPTTEEMETIVTTRLATFGRGAHGRLGYGSNRTQVQPILVSRWPPSMKDAVLQSVACGGAHTVVLAHRPHPKCLANPYGYRTYIATFGYGSNGQLGDGLHTDSFIPVRAKMPKFVVIVEVSAGHSWSMCRSIDGRLFTFGKGLRGQLGQDSEKFSFVPREVENAFGSFVRIASGYAHNIGVVVPKRHLTTRIAETYAKEHGDIFHRTRPQEYISCRLTESANSSTYQFSCCRRQSNLRSPYKPVPGVVPNHDILDVSSQRYYCHTCRIESVCVHCINICHKRHVVTEIDYTAHPEDLTLPAAHSLTYRFSRRPRINKYLVNDRRPPPPEFKVMSPKVVGLLLRDIRDAAAAKAAAEARRANRERKAKLKAKKDRVAGLKKGGRHSDASSGDEGRPRSKGASPANRSVVGSPSGTPHTPAARARNTIIPACKCGLYNSHCRLLPMIPETLHEGPGPARRVKRVVPRKSSLIAQVAQSVSSTVQSGVEAVSSTVRRMSTHVPESIINAMSSPGKTRKSVSGATRSSPSVVVRDKRMEAIRALKSDDRHARDRLLKLDRRTIHGLRYFQVVVKKYLKIVASKKANKDYELLRHEACREHWEKHILGTIFSKIGKAYSEFREVRELNAMRYEDDLTHKFMYYQRLQQAIIGVEAMKQGVKTLFGSISAQLPRVSEGIANTEEWRPTFAFSWNSVRQQQMRLHPLRRLNLPDVALLTQHFPRYHQPGFYREGQWYDKDINHFTLRYLRDVATQNWRLNMRAKDTLRREHMAKVAAAALEKLNRQRNAAKDAVAAMLNKGPPPPPKAGPPRKIVVANHWFEKIKQREKQSALHRAAELREDQPFDPYAPTEVDPFSHRRRRATLLDPCALTSRLRDMRDSIYFSAYTKRRDSLPAKLAHFRTSKVFDHADPANLLKDPKEAALAKAAAKAPTTTNAAPARVPPTPAAIAQRKTDSLKESLDAYTAKLDLTAEMMDWISGRDGPHEEAESYLKRRDKRVKQTVKQLLFSSYLTAKLPAEVRAMLLDNERRRSIGEPERVNRHLALVLKSREKYAELVKLSNSHYGIHRRKRSFDINELADDANGISAMLGYGNFEAAPRPITMSSLRQDAYLMEKGMIECRFIEQTEEFSKKVYSFETQLKSVKADKMKSAKAAAKAGGKTKRKSIGGMTASSKKAGLGAGLSGRLGAFAGSGKTLFGFDEAEEDAWQDEGPDFQSVPLGQVVVWQEYYSADGQAYYYNPVSGESVWTQPMSDEWGEVQIQSQYQDDQGAWYWYNNTTRDVEYMQY